MKEESWTRLTKASRVRVLDSFLPKEHRGYELETSGHGRSSIRAIIIRSSQEVSPTWALHCGYHLRTDSVEALNELFHSAWGIAAKTSTTSAYTLTDILHCSVEKICPTSLLN